MAEETIVAVYDTPAHAELAAADLKAAGIPGSAISVHANASAATSATTAAPAREQGFWSSLFGGEPDHDTAVYERSVTAGSSVVTVKVADTHVAQAMEILEAHHPVDIDERATGYGLAQTTTASTSMAAAPVMPAVTGTMATAPVTGRMDDGLIQLSEEQIAIGKRVVNKGGTRIRRFVVETPVEEQVTLHDEKVTLERRPVTDARPVADAFTDKTIEMTESTEEAVVSKTARVVEEVGLRKEATDRVETIRDTVRKDEVEIEQIPAGTTAPRAPKI